MQPLSGGDISEAFCLYTQTERLFCKVNRGQSAYKMFLLEREGLDEINMLATIKAPKVYVLDKLKGVTFLIMEYIEPKTPTSKEMESLGHQLAEMHTTPVGSSFGWRENNFIGSLPQSNTEDNDWASFYVKERLVPQLKLANTKKLLHSSEIPQQEKMLMVCQNLLGAVKPSLLHGDLWGGNYLINSEGVPYLIDPSIYYGHNEVDIAMTKLFGGFHPSFYNAYFEHPPINQGQKERLDLYQLYYLLVHLNLFGKSYYGSVRNLLKTYFK